MSRVYACVWVAFIRSWWFNVYFCHESDNNFCLTYLLWFRSSAWGQGHVEKPLANGDFAEQGARAPRVGVAMTNECQRPMSNVCRHTASRYCHHRHILIAHCRHQHEQSKKVERIPTEWRRNPNSSSIRKKNKIKHQRNELKTLYELFECEHSLWSYRLYCESWVSQWLRASRTHSNVDQIHRPVALFTCSRTHASVYQPSDQTVFLHELLSCSSFIAFIAYIDVYILNGTVVAEECAHRWWD